MALGTMAGIQMVAALSEEKECNSLLGMEIILLE
jgi:hypothetical protein